MELIISTECTSLAAFAAVTAHTRVETAGLHHTQETKALGLCTFPTEDSIGFPVHYFVLLVEANLRGEGSSIGHGSECTMIVVSEELLLALEYVLALCLAPDHAMVHS